MDVIIAARLSRKQKDGQEGIGLDTQDSRSTAFCERNSHNVVAVVPDTKSGTVPPWERKNLKPWLTDPELMRQYQGIVAYKTDRLSRGKDEDFSTIEAWASANGKKLIIVNDADGIYYPSRTDSDYWQWVTEKRTARKEWENIQERNVRANTELRSRGMLANRFPWGYEVVGEKYAKTIQPTEICRTYAPQIFQRVIDGESYDSIAHWLNDSGVKTANGGTWSGAHIGRLIKNETYKGRFKTRDGKLLLTCESVVDAAVWRRANDAASKRPKRGAPKPKAMLTGGIYCMRCGARMNRHSGGRVSSRTISYRCTGQGIGINRKSCGNMVSLSRLDSIVSDRMARMHSPIIRVEIVKGSDHVAELEEIQDQLSDLSNQGLSWDAEDAERARLRAEYMRVSHLPIEDDRIEEVNTGITYAAKWESLSDPERGKWLQDAGIRIYALKAADESAVREVVSKPGSRYWQHEEYANEDGTYEHPEPTLYVPEVTDGIAVDISGRLDYPLYRSRYLARSDRGARS